MRTCDTTGHTTPSLMDGVDQSWPEGLRLAHGDSTVRGARNQISVGAVLVVHMGITVIKSDVSSSFLSFAERLSRKCPVCTGCRDTCPGEDKDDNRRAIDRGQLFS
jgi:hypothetical protein